MTEYDRKEKADHTAYELQESMYEEVLKIKVDKPTVAYNFRKINFLNREFKPLPNLTVQEIYTQEDWLLYADYKHLDAIIWLGYKSEYLPYLFGSIDLRRGAITAQVIDYDEKTFDKGLRLITVKLEKVYKVIKFRNPLTLLPREVVLKDWRKKVTLENKGNINYFYRWNNTVYSLRGTTKALASFVPSYHHFNKVGVTIPPHYYTLSNDYTFMFVPGVKNPQEIAVDSALAVDVTPLLLGDLLKSNLLWPKDLKRLVFPMLAVETMDYPLFDWLIKEHYQSNRNLNYYSLSEKKYYQFLNNVGGVTTQETGTMIYNGIVYGDDIIPQPQTVELALLELKAKSLAIESWEDYE